MNFVRETWFGFLKLFDLPRPKRVDPAEFPEDEFPVWCMRCGYELRGLPENRCPECGRPFDRGELIMQQYVRLSRPESDTRSRLLKRLEKIGWMLLVPLIIGWLSFRLVVGPQWERWLAESLGTHHAERLLAYLLLLSVTAYVLTFGAPSVRWFLIPKAIRKRRRDVVAWLRARRQSDRKAARMGQPVHVGATDMQSLTQNNIPAPAAVYRQRRARLAAALSRPMVLFSGHAPAKNYSANTHPYRPGSTYLYFGGPPIENAALLIEPRSDGDAGCTLLRNPTGLDDAVWGTALPPDAELAAAAGLSTSRVADCDQLGTLLKGRPTAAVTPPFPDTLAWAARLGVQTATDDEARAIIDLRLCKDEHELAAMRRAAKVSVDAHRAAMAATRPGRRESDVAAAYLSVLTANHCQPSFAPIITVHGEVLHCVGYPNKLNAGQMLLIDAGAEGPDYYACDITRTVPVDGKWTPIQRQLYDTVERANRETTAACVPGARFRDVHDLAARIICEGLVEAELLRGDPAELVQRTAHALFFVHGLGHLIGLDVHDMEDFGDLAGYASGRTRRTEFGSKFLRLDRDLTPGMCLTIEPGVYLVPAIWESAALVKPLADVINRPKIDALLRDQFGGIRVEHTICVRAQGGPEVLSAAVPTQADEVTALVSAK